MPKFDGHAISTALRLNFNSSTKLKLTAEAAEVMQSCEEPKTKCS